MHAQPIQLHMLLIMTCAGIHACFCCSSKYVGEGMAASLTGLALGGIIMLLRTLDILLDEDTAQKLLTFSNSNFFV